MGKILVFSGYDERLYAPAVLSEGASGFVQKQEPVENLIAAIRHIISGGIAVSDEIKAEHLQKLARQKTRPRPSLAQLSRRELQILEMIAHGKTIREIAHRLQLSQKTVEAHRASIKKKLNLKTAPELVHFAVRRFGVSTVVHSG